MTGTATPERAPVQRDCRLPIGRYGCAHKAGAPEHSLGTVAWAEHLEAYATYAKRYGSDQTAQRLADRGGFGYWEVCNLLGHAPRTWEPR